MSVFDEFRSLVARVDADIDLAEGCALICEAAGHDGARTVVADQLQALDTMVSGSSVVEIVRSLRDDLGFSGDSHSYDDPQNSLLHLVIERRTGLPILLAVVVHDLCRRRGVPMRVIGMPGHVLVSDAGSPATYVDPFHSSVPMTASGAQGLYETMTGLSNFAPSHLEPIGSRAVLWRILNNLASRYRRSGEVSNLRWVMKLRTSFPDAGPEIEREFARLMGSTN